VEGGVLVGKGVFKGRSGCKKVFWWRKVFLKSGFKVKGWF
jgi:hypothetical protein